MAGAEFVVTTLTDAKPFRMGELSAAQIFTGLRDAGAKIVMDLDVYNLENHPSELIELCDILFMNSLGFQRFNESGNDVVDTLRAGALAVIVTRDSDGCDLHTSDGLKRIPGYSVDVVDVTGAGDTFSSSFLYAYSTTGDLSDAAEFGNAAAALSVGIVGARGGMTTADSVRAFMAQNTNNFP